MVLGKNVSYDVYGKFCMKSERQNMLTGNSDLAGFRINTSKKVKYFP